MIPPEQPRLFEPEYSEAGRSYAIRLSQSMAELENRRIRRINEAADAAARRTQVEATLKEQPEASFLRQVTPIIEIEPGLEQPPAA